MIYIYIYIRKENGKEKKNRAVGYIIYTCIMTRFGVLRMRNDAPTMHSIYKHHQRDGRTVMTLQRSNKSIKASRRTSMDGRFDFVCSNSSDA